MSDLISTQDLVTKIVDTAIRKILSGEQKLTKEYEQSVKETVNVILNTARCEIVRCKDCKHWKRQTAYNGNPLSFGFCESDYMWRSLYGETYEVSHIDTDDDFYCGYAERKDT